MSTENPERRRIYWCDDSQVMWTGLVPVGVEPMAIGHACEIHGGRTSSIDYGKGTYRCETSHEHAIPAQWLEQEGNVTKVVDRDRSVLEVIPLERVDEA